MVTPLKTGLTRLSPLVHLMIYGVPASSVVTASPKVRLSVVPLMLADSRARAVAPARGEPAMVTSKGRQMVFHAPSL